MSGKHPLPGRAGSGSSGAPTVVVITVSYNSSAVLADFLGSVAASEEYDVPVLVVDNASGDVEQTRRIVEAHGAELVPSTTNLGYGGAVNLALDRVSEYEYVLISNPDVLVHAGAISALVDALRGDERVGAVGPRILNSDGSVYPSARRLPSLRTGAGHAVLGGFWRNNPWSRAYRLDSEYGGEPRDAGWLSGSFLLVRSRALLEVDGFDPQYFMYFEDVDLGYRLGRAGWKNVYLPGASITHTGAHSTTSTPEAMLAAHHESAYRYLSRKYPGWYFAPLRLVLRTGLRIRSWWVRRTES